MTFAARAGLLTASAALALGALAGTAAAANTVVQVDVSSVLDARSVSTVANGVVTVWSPTEGVDQDGNGDGYVTNAVEAILKTQGKTKNNAVNKALPDDGMFPADAGGRYPAIALHFSNAAPITSMQTHQLHHTQGPQSFSFDVPNATYSKMFLIITSSEGTGELTVTLTYAGGVAPTVLMLKLPDYGVGGAAAGDPVYFNLIQGMFKWNTTDVESDNTASHTITGIEINPTPTATLTNIEIAKTNGAYIDFWGATGIATSAVTTGTGGSSGTTDAGAGGSTDASVGDSGAGGVGGEAGVSGTTGAAGAATTGGAGSTGGAAGETGSTGTAGASGAAGSTGAAGVTGTTGAAGATTGARSSGGGCSLSGAPSRSGASLLLALIACALPLRRRRRR